MLLLFAAMLLTQMSLFMTSKVYLTPEWGNDSKSTLGAQDIALRMKSIDSSAKTSTLPSSVTSMGASASASSSLHSPHPPNHLRRNIPVRGVHPVIRDVDDESSSSSSDQEEQSKPSSGGSGNTTPADPRERLFRISFDLR